MTHHHRKGTSAQAGGVSAKSDALDKTAKMPVAAADAAIDVDHDSSRGQSKSYIIIAIVYLLGIFIGAIDTGIVTPARVVIQNDMGADSQLGVWLITIYTLVYAAAMPIMGKLADRHGRKYIYLLCIALFGVGSLLCGLSEMTGNFYFLLVARAIQAIGGGGIVPIATAEFGTAFPVEKRGMALGLVGGVYGVANVFGASAGSLVLDIAGRHNWEYIFYINIPFCLLIIAAGILALPNHKEDKIKPIDGLGTCVLVVMVLSLLYGLRNIDFFDFLNSLTSTDVWPFLLGFFVLLPVFVAIEHRAKDPILNLSYFHNRNIILTMTLAIVTGVIMMGIIFVPQFAENALFLPSGDGGYWVILLGLCSGIGAPMSGKLIDKFGVKLVLLIGLVSSVLGSFYLSLIAAPNPSLLNVIVSFVLLGLGIGFVVGTPINYMMLDNTDDKEANSALATLSLMRSLGTAVAPTIMIAFIAHSGALIQDRVMDVMPDEITISALPYQQELTDEIAKLKTDENTADKVADMDFPDLTSMQTVHVDMNADSGTYTIPDDVQQLMKDSDVTTIAANSQTMASVMFAQIAPDKTTDIENGINSGTEGITSAQGDMAGTIADMQSAYSELGDSVSQMDVAIAAQQDASAQMQSFIPTLQKMENYSSMLDLMPDSAKASMPQSVLDQLADVKTPADLKKKISTLTTQIDTMNASITGMEKQITADKAALKKATDPATIGQLTGKIAGEEAGLKQMQSAVKSMTSAKTMMESQLPTLQKMENYSSMLDLMPDSAKASMPQSVLDQLADVKTPADLQAKIDELSSTIAELQSARNEMYTAQSELADGIVSIQSASDEMRTTLDEMSVLRATVPSAFDEAEQKYLATIDDESDLIEATFQSTLDEGFTGMFNLVGIVSIAGIIVIFFYKDKRKRRKLDEEDEYLMTEKLVDREAVV